MKRIIKSFLKRIVLNFNFILIVKLNGKYFRIPILGGIGYSNFHTEEKWMIPLLKKILKNESSSFVDVGVNVGQTLLKLRSLDEKINYIGFEPNSNCIHYLGRLIKLNSLKNISLLPIGISTKTEIGELHFYEDSETDSSASIDSNFRKNKIIHKEYVSLFNVENLMDVIGLRNISVLKIDVEGSELEVLNSFKSNIKSSEPFILIEILPVYNENDNPERFKKQERIQVLMNDLNYSLFRINKHKNDFLGLDKINSFGVHSNLENCDYLFVPNSKLDKLLD